MKKIISAILLILVVFMLEFNWLQTVFAKAYVWIEPVIALSVMIAMIFWNGLQNKNV